MNLIKAALAQRSAIFEANLQNKKGDETETAKLSSESLWGEGVRIANKRTLKPKLLTPTEKDEVVTKYESGMTMTAISNIYGCHYTTVGSILRRKGATIRE